MKLKLIKQYLNRYNFVLAILIFSAVPYTNYANKLDSLKKKKLIINSSLIISSAISYTGLYQMWYKEYPSIPFHFFNDLEEWKSMDKVGHIYTAYHLNRFMFNLLESNKIQKPLLKSSLYSFAYMVGIEAFDGFSEKWGFSNYDLISNGIGIFIFAFQERQFKHQFVKIKFSSHLSSIAHCRPSLLGSNNFERIIKDYNGQSYWATLNLNKIFKEKTALFKYINLAIGYTIDGFTGARNNQIIGCNCIDCKNLKRTSSLLLSIDINLEPIKGKYKLLDILIKPFSILKVPAPTFIINEKPSFKFFYF